MADEDLPKDSLDVTPLIGITSALNDLSNELKDDLPSKAIVVMLWDDEDKEYRTRWYNAGMKTSEMVALLEYIKHDLLELLHGRDHDNGES